MSCNICSVASGNIKRLVDALTHLLQDHPKSEGFSRNNQEYVWPPPSRLQSNGLWVPVQVVAPSKSKVSASDSHRYNKKKKELENNEVLHPIDHDVVKEVPVVTVKEVAISDRDQNSCGDVNHKLRVVDDDDDVSESHSIHSVPSLVSLSTDEDNCASQDDFVSFQDSILRTPPRNNSCISIPVPIASGEDTTNNVMAWGMLAAVLSSAPSPALKKETMSRKKKEEIAMLWSEGSSVEFFDAVDELNEIERDKEGSVEVESEDKIPSF